MALPVIPASGPIGLASLCDGLGLTGEISMSHTGVRSLAKKSSGSVSFSDIRNGGGLTAVKLSYQTPNFVTPSLYYILNESTGTTKVYCMAELMLLIILILQVLGLFPKLTLLVTVLAVVYIMLSLVLLVTVNLIFSKKHVNLYLVN